MRLFNFLLDKFLLLEMDHGPLLLTTFEELLDFGGRIFVLLLHFLHISPNFPLPGFYVEDSLVRCTHSILASS